MPTIMLTQKNRLRLTREEHAVITALSFHAARLYNVGLYSVRQYYFANNTYLNYAKNYHVCKVNENYTLLLSDTSQQILRLVERNMKSFFALWQMKHSGKYSDAVRLPRYKGKQELGIVPIQGRSARLKQGKVYIGLSKAFKARYTPSFNELVFTLPKHIQVDKLQEVRIIPLCGGKEFDIEYVYQKQREEAPDLNKETYLSIDMGLDNFATCFDSTSGFSCILDGKRIKHINWKYNKDLARLQRIKDHQHHTHTTARMFRLTRKRGFQLNEYMNLAVKYITDYCLNYRIGTIVVGDFSGVKNGINIGKRNNQNFVQIPYGAFRRKLKSKCEQLGIACQHIEESYTSKTSFLDREFPKKHESYQGKRVKRGLFRASDGTTLNADVNGAAQILHKYLKSNGLLKEPLFQLAGVGCVNHPRRVKLLT